MDETNTGGSDHTPIEETGTEETQVEEHEFLSIDDLLNLNEEDFEEFTDDANHTGMKPLHEWMSHIPEEPRKHIANLRASYTRKTQELAQARKDLEAERLALREQQELAINNPVIEEMKQYNTDEEHDLYAQEGMQKEIKKQAALMVQELMKPVQEKVQLQKREMQLHQFKEQHPEITSDEYRQPMYEMLQARPELRLEDAYWLVKGKIDAQKAKAILEQRDQDKKRRRSTLQKTTTGSSTNANGTPDFKGDAWAAYQWHKANKGRK